MVYLLFGQICLENIKSRVYQKKEINFHRYLHESFEELNFRDSLEALERR